jgi:hypothetical protein
MTAGVTAHQATMDRVISSDALHRAPSADRSEVGVVSREQVQ